MYNRFFLQQTVFDAALDRIRWVFREFKNVYVSFSGGKDSTVVLNLALQVAEEMGRLPLPVLFIDQECEWQAVIDYIRVVMTDPRVDPRWLQVPIKISNATSSQQQWLQCWEPGVQWIREKEENSIHRNVYGTDRFKPLFGRYLDYHHGTQPVASLAGMRCEESPGRTLGMTVQEAYKGMTWGGVQNGAKKHILFCPLYDWSYRDIWKAIHDHGWPYTKVYDWQYQHRVPVRQMRVSSLHHEMAVGSLYYLQEFEPETWEAVQRRIVGVNTVGQLKTSAFTPSVPPPMFTGWLDYRDYLLENMPMPDEHRAIFRKEFDKLEKAYEGSDAWTMDRLHQSGVSAILLNDTYGVVLGNFRSANPSQKQRDRWRREREETAARLGASAIDVRDASDAAGVEEP